MKHVRTVGRQVLGTLFFFGSANLVEALPLEAYWVEVPLVDSAADPVDLTGYRTFDLYVTIELGDVIFAQDWSVTHNRGIQYSGALSIFNHPEGGDAGIDPLLVHANPDLPFDTRAEMDTTPFGEYSIVGGDWDYESDGGGTGRIQIEGRVSINAGNGEPHDHRGGFRLARVTITSSGKFGDATHRTEYLGGEILLSGAGPRGSFGGSSVPAALRPEWIPLAWLGEPEQSIPHDGTVRVPNAFLLGEPVCVPYPLSHRLMQPLDGATNQRPDVVFSWDEACDAVSYRMRVAIDPGFENVVFDAEVAGPPLVLPDAVLAEHSTYYWTVEANTPNGIVVSEPIAAEFSVTACIEDWSTLPISTHGEMFALSPSFSSGALPSVIALGTGRIEFFDGIRWSTIAKLEGGTATAFAAALFNDGLGKRLYVTGDFQRINALATGRFACWDGTDWTPFNPGLDGPGRALAAFDDGSGLALYVGGDFLIAGNSVASHVVRLRQGVWENVGGGTVAPVRALTVYDDGSGAALYAGGDFDVAGEVIVDKIARWNGATWEAVLAGEPRSARGVARGNTTPPPVGIRTLAVHDDGTGPALFAGGDFTTIDGVAARRIAAWRDGSWHALGLGANGPVRAIVSGTDGLSPRLLVGGDFSAVGLTAAQRLGVWQGSTWAAFEPVIGSQGARVRSLQLVKDASGSTDLWVGGRFDQVAGNDAVNVARLDGCPSESRSTDLNGDGVVNTADLGIVLSRLGGQTDRADLNQDGVVDVADLALVLAAFGR